MGWREAAWPLTDRLGTIFGCFCQRNNSWHGCRMERHTRSTQEHRPSWWWEPKPTSRRRKTHPWCIPGMYFQWVHVGNAARPRQRRVLVKDTPLKPFLAPQYMGDPQRLSGWCGWQSLKPPRGTRLGLNYSSSVGKEEE